MRRLIARSLALVLAVPTLAAAQKNPLDGFDAYVAKAVKDWGPVGLAVAVVKDGKLVFAKGYGVRTLGSSEAVDSATRFAIGSTTKAMTAAALGILVDEGKVRWDDPVVKYLPSLVLYDPVMTREVTVRDVLTHHTGMPGTDFLWSGGDYSRDEMFHKLRFVKPASFRSRYEYQNVQYALAGAVLEAASGIPWAEFLRTRLWQPIGMTRTLATVKETEGQPNVATPHDVIDDTLRAIKNRSVDPVAPAGSVWSSVGDMSKWMRFILDSGRVDGKRLISERTFRELITPQVVVPLTSFYPQASLAGAHYANYGLGWFLQDYRGDQVKMHTGSIDGMCAIVGLIPDKNIGVYVLENTDHIELRHALMYTVFDRFNGRSDHDWSAEMKKQMDGFAQQGIAARRAAESARVMGTNPTLPLARYAGTYADSLYGEATVSLDGDALRLKWGNAFSGKLSHWNYDTFRARWEDRRNGLSLVSFGIDARGTPSTLTVSGATLKRKGTGASAAAGGQQ